MSDEAVQCELYESTGLISELRLSGHVTGNALTDAGCDLLHLLGEDAYSRKLLVDMAGTEFLDSSGIGWLVQQNKLFRKNGGMFVLHSIPPMVARVIHLMSLHRVLQITVNADAARTLAEGDV